MQLLDKLAYHFITYQIRSGVCGKQKDRSHHDGSLTQKAEAIVTFSFSYHCSRRNAANRRTTPTNNPITTEEFQPYVVLPNYKARKRQVTDTSISKIPGRSSRLNLSILEMDFLSACPGGIRRNRIKRPRTSPPRGRLLDIDQLEATADWQTYIQKHHRQVTRSVKAPPIGGAAHMLIAKSLTTRICRMLSSRVV